MTQQKQSTSLDEYNELMENYHTANAELCAALKTDDQATIDAAHEKAKAARKALLKAPVDHIVLLQTKLKIFLYEEREFLEPDQVEFLNDFAFDLEHVNNSLFTSGEDLRIGPDWPGLRKATQ